MSSLKTRTTYGLSSSFISSNPDVLKALALVCDEGIVPSTFIPGTEYDVVPAEVMGIHGFIVVHSQIIFIESASRAIMAAIWDYGRAKISSHLVSVGSVYLELTDISAIGVI